MSRQTTLETLLEQLKQANRINLNDMYIGDDGARLLAQYLRSNSNIVCLELRGNKLTSQGITEILMALRNCPSIRLLYLDWNRIAQPQIQGIQALSAFLLSNTSLQHLSLQNNDLHMSDIDQILSVLDRSQLLSLDLKFNPLGGKSGNTLISSINQNRSLLYVELGGCDVNPHDIDKLESILDIHRQSNPIPKQKILQVEDTQQSLQSQQQQQQQQSSDIQQSGINQQYIPNGNASQMITHLEQVLEQERIHSLHIKQRMERELDELSRRERSDARLLEELDVRSRELDADNRAARYAVDKLRDECALVERQQGESLRGLDDKVRQNEFILAELEKKHRANLDRVLGENNFRIRDMNRDWEARCRNVEDRARLLEQENGVLEDELRQLSDRQALLRVTYDQELRDLGRRVEEEEYQKFHAVSQNLEAKINASEEALQVLRRRNEDVILEYRRRDKLSKEELQQLHEELQNLKSDSRAFSEQNQKYKVECDRLKQEAILKETAVLKYEQEINTLNEQIELKRKMHRDQLDAVLRDQSNDQAIWEQDREKQYQRVQELERILQQSHSENQRLRQEFQRLSEAIQFNVQKSLQQTFIENNYF